MDALKDVKDQISEDIKAFKVVVYMKGNRLEPMCGFSAKVVHMLNECGAEFETRDVLADERLRQAIKEFADWPTIPQIYINGDFVGGCDIATELFQSGELVELLK